MATPLQLPPLRDPQRYAGLYAVQFAHGVAVGYTFDEVAIVLAEQAYCECPVYRIHRIDAAGRVELAGISARDLAGDECMIFASRDAAQASGDFAALRRLAAEDPLPCGVRIELIDLADLDPPHAVCLLYTKSASTMVAEWLLRAGFGGGDQVIGGAEATGIRRAASTVPIASSVLAARIAHAPRTREQVLASVHEPLQR
jgi:hypothetical protein